MAEKFTWFRRSPVAAVPTSSNPRALSTQQVLPFETTRKLMAGSSSDLFHEAQISLCWRSKSVPKIRPSRVPCPSDDFPNLVREMHNLITV